MKYLYLFFMLNISLLCFAQKQNVYFLKFDGTEVHTRDSADVIRIVREPDSGAVNFKVLEYYKKGQVRLTGESLTVEPLTFEGSAISYYPNGKRMSIEVFDHGVKKTSYTYYPNGKPQAVREYPETMAGANIYKNYTLTTYNDTTGKAQVTNGNGDFAGFEIDMAERYAEGKIVNGKREGVWKGNYPADKISFVEEYHDGNLLTGTCTTAKNKKYTYKAEVVLLNVGNPEGPTFNLARSANVIPEPALIMRSEVTTSVMTTTTTRVVGVSAGSPPPSSRASMSSSGGNFGSAPNLINLQEHGLVLVSFTIDKNGRTTDLRIRKSLNEDLDKTALKIAQDGIRIRTGNKPAILLGRPIDSQYTMPITF